MAASTAVAKTANTTAPVVNPEQTLKASKALLSHIKKAAAAKTDTKPNLLADEDSAFAETPIWLTITTKKHIHETQRLQPGKITVPHSLNPDSESTICLITADPQRWFKNAVASEEFPEELRSRITRVIDLTHLKKKFKDFGAQRELYRDHDIFLADDRIINRLPKALGKTFYRNTAKRPIPVVLMARRERVDGKKVARPVGKKTKRDPVENPNARPIPEIAGEIKKAIGAALVNLSPTTNTAIKCGFANWEPEQLAANVDKIIADLVERFVPQKWKNVRNVYIKGPETAALPIYQTDELWLEETHVVPDEQAPPSGLPVFGQKKLEKANVGKKRKSLDGEAEPAAIEAPATTEEDRPKKKTKKVAADKAVAESNDDKLDKEIAERKSKLKKQKASAKKAVDI